MRRAPRFSRAAPVLLLFENTLGVRPQAEGATPPVPPRTRPAYAPRPGRRITQRARKITGQRRIDMPAASTSRPIHGPF